MHYKMNYAAYETRIPADLQHSLYPPPANIKSTTSRPHLRKPEALCSSRPRPFDPDDLTRRLCVVLAEQQAQAERKRRARAAVEAESEAKRAALARVQAHAQTETQGQNQTQAQTQAQQNIHSPTATVSESRPGAPALKLQTEELTRKSRRKSSSKQSVEAGADNAVEAASPKSHYHHVPQVAASQFTRTTTVEPISSRAIIHKLSAKALESHIDELSATAGTRRSDALRRTQSQKEWHHEQNTFQNIHRLASTTEDDEQTSMFPKAPKGPLGEFIHSRSSEREEKQIRRKSMGDMLHRIAAAFEPPTGSKPGYSPIDALPTLSHCEVVVGPEEHRVDWTQSDEILNQPKPATTHNLLRKTDSKWTLKSKLGSFRKHKADAQTASSNVEKREREKEKELTVASPKSPSKLGFLARFKRQ